MVGRAKDRDEYLIDKFCQNVLAARSAAEYQELIELLKQMVSAGEMQNGFMQACQQALDDGKGDATLPSEIEILDFGFKFWKWVRQFDEDSREYSLISRVIGKLCTDFWSNISVRPEGELPQKNALDFICCFVVDRRGVYLSNFQSSGADKFTRTIFVDLALTGYQRGRLAERLCDISTHRGLCVRDLDRVRCIWQGMDEITGELNSLEDQIFHPENAVRECKELTLKLTLLQQQFDQMNLFLVYGIRGRYLSSRASLEVIEQRIHDTRQERISGFPMLGEFLERRVADAIKDITYMSERYDYLRERIQDAYNRVRTQLNSIQTQSIVEFLANVEGFTEGAVKTMEATRDLQVVIQDNMKEQVAISGQIKVIEEQLAESVIKQQSLGIVADIFTVVAGTYYGTSLAYYVWKSLVDQPWYTKLVIVLGISLALSIIINLMRQIVTGSSTNIFARLSQKPSVANPGEDDYNRSG